MEKNNCPLCVPHSTENIIWQNGFCRIIPADELGYPGFIRVILQAHVKEMSDLTQLEQQQLMGVVFQVERCVRQVMLPEKVNLAALGNMVPHTHWHIIPRYSDDASFPGSVWSEKLRITPESILKERKAKELELIQLIKETLS